MDFRKEIINSIIPFAEKNENIILLVGDMGFGVCDNFKEKFPNRIINCGIMEQGMVGIAAGMAIGGHLPVVYSIVNFLVFRALEQIRNDVVLQKLNVKFIGTGANNYFRFLGNSHCCGNNDVKLMELIGMRVFDSFNPKAPHFYELVSEWINDPQTGYIRV